MGLDMGVVVERYPETTVKTIGMNRLFKKTDQAVYEDSNFKKPLTEVIYFRNAYEIRNRLSRVIAHNHFWGEFAHKGGYAILTLRDVARFIEVLDEMSKEKENDDYYIPTKEDVRNMKILYRFMKLNPNASVKYYDSF